MLATCSYADDMPKMIQIRNVPEDTHRKLKSRAALAGMTLSDYLLAEIQRLLETPSLQEWMQKIPRYDDVLDPSPTQIIREERDRR